MEIEIGMLWFDDTLAAPIGERIERAAYHYKGKYSRLSNVCYVHSDYSADTDCRKLPTRCSSRTMCCRIISGLASRNRTSVRKSVW